METLLALRFGHFLQDFNKKFRFWKKVTKSVFPTLYRTFRGPKPVIWLSRLEFESSPFAEIARRRSGVFINFMNLLRGASELITNSVGGTARTLPYNLMCVEDVRMAGWVQ